MKALTIMAGCAVALLSSFGVLRFAWYGFSLERAIQGCPYSEEEEQLPPGVRGNMYDAGGMFEGRGSDFDEQCAPLLRATRGQVSTTDVEMEGKPVRQLPEGSLYRIEKKVTLYTHGVEASFGGRGPVRYYVVTDSKGQSWYVWAGLNKEDYLQP